MKGTVMVLVVVNHTEPSSLLQYVTKERLGVVTGAKMFVAMSGFVLGMVNRKRVAAAGLRVAAAASWHRARTLYLVALAVSVVTWVVGRIGIDTAAVSTYTDPVSGQRYDLYQHDGPLDLLVGMVTLRVGPSQFNIMALLTAFVLLTPLALWAMSRRRTLPLLAVIWTIWAVNETSPIRVLPSQSEAAFPLGLWQALFFTALAAGYHRERLLALRATRRGERRARARARRLRAVPSLHMEQPLGGPPAAGQPRACGRDDLHRRLPRALPARAPGPRPDA